MRRDFQSVNGQLNTNVSLCSSPTFTIIVVSEHLGPYCKTIVVQPVKQRPDAVRLIILFEVRVEESPHDRTEICEMLKQSLKVDLECQSSRRIMQVDAINEEGNPFSHLSLSSPLGCRTIATVE